MKKFVLPCFLLSAIALCIISSCSKTSVNPLNPLPANNRLHSYARARTGAGYVPLKENYTFEYGAGQKVTKVYFTTTDPLGTNELFFYTYSNDSIFKVITNVNPVDTLEIDTFIQNGQGQIVNTFNRTVPSGYYNTYAYFGKLVGTLTDMAGIPINYQSFSGDVLSSRSAYTDGNRTYTYYGDANRIGDYFQMTSLTQYGYNFWPNAHLVKSIKDPGYTTDIVYTIDAYSKITQSTVTIADSVGNTFVNTYDLQYETYK